METEREQEEQDWRRSPDAEDGRVAERLDQIRERVEHSQSGPRGRAEPLTNDDLDWLYEAARRLRRGGGESGAGLDPYDWYLVARDDDCACGHEFSMHTSHGCLSCDCGVEIMYGWACADRLRDAPSEERPGGSGDTVRLSDQDVEHTRRWAENATPEQVAAAMREKMRLERVLVRLRRSTPEASGGTPDCEMCGGPNTQMVYSERQDVRKLLCTDCLILYRPDHPAPDSEADSE